MLKVATVLHSRLSNASSYRKLIKCLSQGKFCLCAITVACLTRGGSGDSPSHVSDVFALNTQLLKPGIYIDFDRKKVSR